MDFRRGIICFTLIAKSRLGLGGSGFNKFAPLFFKNHQTPINRRLNIQTGKYFGCFAKNMSVSSNLLPENVVLEDNQRVFRAVCVNGNEAKDKILSNGFNKYTYEETITALNGLQSNSSLLSASEKTLNVAKRNLAFAPKLLESVGLQDKHLDKLNAIHIAGTKGKGSTCALTECILRKCGYKTGFYSSPHLINVTERIRINGEPLPKDEFIHYFWDVYNKLLAFAGESNMPAYFHFLTILAFKVFTEENVDVAVIETGIGGEYDTTNIIKCPSVVGITSIGIDHTTILGDTLEKIAWQKAGILKKGVDAFTVPQEPRVLRVFYERSLEKNCQIELSPPLRDFQDAFGNKLVLGMPGKVQEINASLALQLSRAWLRKMKPNDFPILIKSRSKNGFNQNTLLNYAKTFPVPEPFAKGLLETKWLGRFQTIRKNSVVYFLDGAHTPESVELCSDWFADASAREAKEVSSVYKVLLFNCTKGRKPEAMLSPFAQAAFDCAIFCPNHVTKDISASSDQTNFNVDPDHEYQQCLRNRLVWSRMQTDIRERRQAFQGAAGKSLPSSISFVFDCLTDAIDWLTRGRDGPTPKKNDDDHSHQFGNCSLLSQQLPQPADPKLVHAEQLQILVTGSLHLVGGVLKVLGTKYGNDL